MKFTITFIVSLSFFLIGSSQPFERVFSQSGPGYFAINTPDGGYALLTVGPNNKSKVVKIDGALSLQWANEYDLVFPDPQGNGFTPAICNSTFSGLPALFFTGSTSFSNGEISWMSVDLATGNINYYKSLTVTNSNMTSTNEVAIHCSQTTTGHVITGFGPISTCGFPNGERIPFLITIDQSGNVVNEVGYTSCFPAPIGINSTFYSTCVEVTNDGNFILCGSTALSGPDFVMKVDPTGNPIWINEYHAPFPAGYIREFSNGDFAFCSSDKITRIDQNGNIIWEFELYRINALDIRIHALEVTAGGEVVLAGEGLNNNLGLVIKLDGLGNILWSKEYLNSQVFYSIVEIAGSGGDLLMAETTTNGGIVRIDQFGNLGLGCENNVVITKVVNTDNTSSPNYFPQSMGLAFNQPSSFLSGDIIVPGCCASFSVTINGPTSTCDPSMTFCANTNPAFSYVWSPSSSTALPYTQNQNCITVTSWGVFQNTGTVTFTVTVTDNFGCSSTSTILVNSCCTQPTPSCPLNPNLYNTSASQTATNCCLLFQNCSAPVLEIWDKFFSINGTFTVDQDLLLKNCDVLLGPNSRIEILPGRTLTITGDALLSNTPSRLHACTNMWDGIYIQPGANFITNTFPYIEDAINAVVSVGGGNYLIEDTWFNKNQIGLLVQPFSGAHTGTVTNSRFTCRNLPIQFTTQFTPSGVTTYPPAGLLPPFAAIGKTFSGISIDQVQNGGNNALTIGNPSAGLNLFDNIHNGIISATSAITVLNGHYQFIHNVGVCVQNCFSCACLPVGNGILATKGEKLIAGNNSFAGQNLFRQSIGGIGINANNVNLDLRLNQINNYSNSIVQSFGILAQGLNTKNAYIFNNRFAQVTNGILVRSPDNSNLTVLNNHLNQFSGTGVWFLQVRDCPFSIDGNTFNTAPNSPAGKFGIRLQNAIISGSNLSMIVRANDIRNVQKGIWLTGFPEVEIVDLNFIRFPAQAPNVPCFGIHVENSGSTLVDQNEITRVGPNPGAPFDNFLFGVSSDFSPGTIVRNNISRKLGTGFRFFGSNAPFNTFICNEMDKCRRGVTLQGTDIGDQGTSFSASDNKWNVFLGRDADVRGFAPFPITPPNWFVQSTTLPWNPATAFIIPATTITTSLSPSIGLCNPPCTNPPCNQPQLARIVREAPPFNGLSFEAKYLAKQEVFKELMNDTLLMNLNTPEDSILQQFHDSAMLFNLGRIVSIRRLISFEDTLQATSLLFSMIPENLIEDNHIEVSKIYLRSWSRKVFDFTIADSALLWSIAIQNPLVGGRAVYDARVMLGISLLDSNEENSQRVYDDDLPLKKIDGVIYPNPTNSDAVFEFNRHMERSGEIQIIDVLGKIVLEYRIARGESKISIEMSTLSSGIYLLKVFIDGELANSERLILNK